MSETVRTSCKFTLSIYANQYQYAPALLRERARKLTKACGGKYRYVSTYDIGRSKSLLQVLKLNLKRPFSTSISF